MQMLQFFHLSTFHVCVHYLRNSNRDICLQYALFQPWQHGAACWVHSRQATEMQPPETRYVTRC